jgi:hypothetical protein
MVVAAPHYGERSRYATLRHNFPAVQTGSPVSLVVQKGCPAAAFFHLLQQLPDRVHRPRAYNHIQVVEPVEQLLTELLGNASSGNDLQVRLCFLKPSQASQKRVHLLFRLASHRASVEKDNVGAADVVYGHVSKVCQLPPDLQRIVFIHLTAEGAHVQPARTA